MPQIIKIQDLNNPELNVYTDLNENQLKHYFEPEPEGIFIAESPAVIERALDAGYKILSLLMEEKYLTTQGKTVLAKCREEEIRLNYKIPVYVSSLDVLSHITGYHLTRGMLGAFRRRRPVSVNEVCAAACRIAVLDDVENPTNVGAIFRCAAALGMDAVLVTSGCADPLQRRSIRVSVGTVFQIPWTYLSPETAAECAENFSPETAAELVDNFCPETDAEHAGKTCPGILRIKSSQTDSEIFWPDRGMEKLHQLGFYITAMALKRDTLSIDDPVLSEKEKIAVILGNEGFGLSDHTISLCDATVKIPMSHGVDSLNVAAASAVMFWNLCRRNGAG